jgi:hypothetical protein
LNCTPFDPSINRNETSVTGYKAVLKLQDSTTYDVEYTGISGNAYGAGESWNEFPPLPGVGQKFTVKYMPGLPANFIIMANDTTTEFGRAVQCQPLKIQYAEALQKYAFDKTNSVFKQSVLETINRLLAGGCLSDNEKQMYQSLKETIKKNIE